MTTFLQSEDLLALVGDLGVGPVQDVGLLDSAAHRPQTVVMGHDPYPTLADKAAVLMQSLTPNHPLVDGNKRLAWLAVYVFLGLNGTRLEAPDDEAYDLVIAVATGAATWEEAARRMAAWLHADPQDQPG